MYLFFLCSLSAGLWISEARGIRRKQIIFDRKVLIVDGFCKKNGTRTNYNRKGTPNNPQFRIVFLPVLTLQKLQEYFNDHTSIRPEDLCFTRANDRPIRMEYAEDVFERALIKAGLAGAESAAAIYSLLNMY